MKDGMRVVEGCDERVEKCAVRGQWLRDVVLGKREKRGKGILREKERGRG